MRQLEDNDVVDCVNLMIESFNRNNGYGPGYRNKNEARWVKFLLHNIEEAKTSPHYFNRGAWREGELVGFFLASTFESYYTRQWVMDVKDCIVKDDRNTAFIVNGFYNAMFDHMREHGGKHWRADSVRSYENCEKYAQFLHKRYNATISLSMRGEIGG